MNRKVLSILAIAIIVFLIALLIIFGMKITNNKDVEQSGDNSGDNQVLSGDKITYKDINSVKVPELQLDDSLQYAEILKDENGSSHAKISDSYVIERPTLKEDGSLILNMYNRI